MSVASILKKAKRRLALVTLAFSDVSKSALANQKNIGLDGAAQAISVSVLSQTKQTLNDMLKGRQTAETQQLAEAWWRAHIAWQRSIWVTEEVNGVMKRHKREATEEEWRQHVEKMAMRENDHLGPVVLMHDIKVDHDDRQGVNTDENGRVYLHQVIQDQARTGNFEITATPGFYFPVDSIDRLFVRHNAEEQFHLELHSTLRPMKKTEHKNLDGSTGYRSHLGLGKNVGFEDLMALDVVEDDYETDPVAEAINLSYLMAVDPDNRYLLRGLQRVAMVQEEYAGLVIRAFALDGEPEVGHHDGHLVLTYRASASTVTADEAKTLYRPS